jgi:tetratricopeptide (TPR) repeat protein
VSQQQLNPTDATDALALRISHRAAQLASEPIPTRLLLRAAELDPDNETDQEQAQLALDRLGALGLIEERPESYALHRLLAAYAHSIASDVEQDLGKVVGMIVRAIRKMVRASDVEQDRSKVVGAAITECFAINQAGFPLLGVPYLPHLSLLVKRTEQTEQQATLLNNLGSLLNAQGNYDAALPLLQRALAIRETALDPPHLDTAGSLNNLALLYRTTGNDAEALPLRSIVNA